MNKQQSEIKTCTICLESHTDSSLDSIITCSKCEVQVHKSCYSEFLLEYCPLSNFPLILPSFFIVRLCETFLGWRCDRCLALKPEK